MSNYLLVRGVRVSLGPTVCPASTLSLQAMPLISRGRRLVRKGELVQVLLQEVGVSHKPRVTLRPVHLHLFSDLLLLSWRKE